MEGNLKGGFTLEDGQRNTRQNYLGNQNTWGKETKDMKQCSRRNLEKEENITGTKKVGQTRKVWNIFLKK